MSASARTVCVNFLIPRPPLPLSLHQLHQLRPALYHHHRISPMTGPKPPCRFFRCARTAKPNTATRPIAVSTPSRWPAPNAVRMSGSRSADGQPLRPPAHRPNTLGDDAIVAASVCCARAKSVAIKGLGGFHLACDALNPAAVDELRARKLRVDKPFALMMPDLTTIEQHCYLSSDERSLLESPARPIVLLRRRPESMTSPNRLPPAKTTWVSCCPIRPCITCFFLICRQPCPSNLRPS